MSADVREIAPEFPKKLEPVLNTRAPYKVIRGGRGSGKSWGVARALLLWGLNRKLRIICTRETQHSIRDSVHQLLVDQIVNLGLQGLYKIQQIQITGVNGTEFVFCGISDQTIAGLKSFERADVCWVEEAQVVTENSWKILLPTIRAPGAEVWITFNPEIDSDPTWRRFVEHPPPGTLSIEMNWRDNPWFNETLENLRQHDKATLPVYEYDWIWEGKCKPAVSGAIYAEELVAMYAEKRVGDYPVDATQPVYAVFDLGWNDSTAIGICQRVVSQLRIIDYVEDSHKAPDHYSALLQAKPYKVSELFLPHDADNSWLTGQTAKRLYQDLGWRITVLPKSPLEDGIRALRLALKSTYIDAKCERLLECLKKYRRVVPTTTGEPSKPMHDEFSHGADMLRYMALAAPQMGANFADGVGLQLPPLKYAWAFK